MNLQNKSISCFILLIFFHQSLSGRFSFDQIYSKIFSKSIQETTQQEIPLQTHGTLIIENIQGNITIKTEWGKNAVLIKATKLATKKEYLDTVSLKIESSKNKVSVKTIGKNEKIKAAVDYELIIPKHIFVQLSTKNGAIIVNKLHGNIKTITQNGSITINNAIGNAVAKTEQGAIYLSNISGTIKAQTDYGKINIDGFTKSVDAQTQKGTILAIGKEVDSVSKIALKTHFGNIDLYIPPSNADIKAYTKKGLLTSEHFITIKPKTVKLDKATWTQFRKEVNGTMGTGEAIILISSYAGHINILQTPRS